MNIQLEATLAGLARAQRKTVSIQQEHTPFRSVKTASHPAMQLLRQTNAPLEQITKALLGSPELCRPGSELHQAFQANDPAVKGNLVRIVGHPDFMRPVGQVVSAGQGSIYQMAYKPFVEAFRRATARANDIIRDRNPEAEIFQFPPVLTPEVVEGMISRSKVQGDARNLIEQLFWDPAVRGLNPNSTLIGAAQAVKAVEAAQFIEGQLAADETLFTRNWFGPHKKFWEPFVLTTLQASEHPIFIEVGTFQGQSIHWVTKQDPRVESIAIDPLSDPRYETKRWDPFRPEIVEHNLREFDGRATLIRGYSDHVLPSIIEPIARGEAKPITVAYIDGEHTANAVYKDLNNVWPGLDEGGVVICDDYYWKGPERGLKPEETPAAGVHRFLEELDSSQYKVLHEGLQIIIRKLA